MREVARLREWVGRVLTLGLLGLLVGAVGATFVDSAPPPRIAAAADKVRDDPTVMTSAAARELIQSLDTDGWDCYDSLDAPPVTRCFAVAPQDDDALARAEVAVTETGHGAVGSASVNAFGSGDDNAHQELAARAALLIGEHLLGGEGEALAARVGSHGPVQIAGQEVWTPQREGASVTLVLRSPTAQEPVLPLPDLPPFERLTDVARTLGMRCSAPSVTTTCTDTDRRLPRSVTASAVAARTTTVTLSAASLAAGEQSRVLREVLPLVRLSGLGGPPMLDWLRQHAHQPLALGDVDGVHVSLSSERSDVHTTVYVTFGNIYA